MLSCYRQQRVVTCRICVTQTFDSSSKSFDVMTSPHHVLTSRHVSSWRHNKSHCTDMMLCCVFLDDSQLDAQVPTSPASGTSLGHVPGSLWSTSKFRLPWNLLHRRHCLPERKGKTRFQECKYKIMHGKGLSGNIFAGNTAENRPQSFCERISRTRRRKTREKVRIKIFSKSNKILCKNSKTVNEEKKTNFSFKTEKEQRRKIDS